MRILSVVLIALFTGLISASTEAQSTPVNITSVAWLTGCWELKDARRVIQEHWMPPLGNTMMNAGRTVRGDSLVEYEMVVIRSGDHGLVYEAHPSGQMPTTFVAVSSTSSSVLFENKTHDFPQQVGYERQSADSLHAWIEGTIRGNKRRIDFPYAKVACQ